MRNNLENNSVKLKSDDLLGSSDSLRENQHSPSLEQLNNRVKQQKVQRKNHDKIDKKEHSEADEILSKDLDKLDISSQNELDDFLSKNYPNNVEAKVIAQDYFIRNNILGISLSQNKLNEHILGLLDNNKELSTADKIKNFKEQLDQQGKSQTEILQVLISKFESEEAVSSWVENWKSFLKLHQFAQDKPPAERKAIQNIISKADFTSENSFENTLSEIVQSSEISNQTKLEISREFNGAYVFSVDDMNSTFKEIMSHKNQIEKAIDTKKSVKDSLSSEIEELENEVEKLPVNNPKRQELEDKLEQKKETLEKTENEIDNLESAKPKDISFQLREGFSAKLNPDGSRSIKINSADFSIKLPSNFLPFTDTKNLRSINFAFPFIALKNQNIANDIFSPNLSNNSIPTKGNRKMGHLILTCLSIDDSKILSEESIKRVNADLARLTSIPGKSGKECLFESGVYNTNSQSLDKNRFKDVLKIIRENRGLRDDAFNKSMENLHNSK